MKTNSQVNVEIPEETLIQLKRTALDNRVTFKDLALVAFQQFLQQKPTQRALILGRAKKKLGGRKLSLAA